MTLTVPPSRRNARSCSSAQTCALDCQTSSRTHLRRVAQRQDEEARAPILAGLRVAHHRAVAVVHLAFLAGRGGDDDARLRRRRAAERDHEASHAGVARGEAMVIDEVLPDRHGVAPAMQGFGDQLAVGLAGTRRRRALGHSTDAEVGGHRRRDNCRFRRGRVGGHPRPNGRFCRAEVGGHLSAGGRICRHRVGGHPRRGGRFWRPGSRAPAAGANRDARRAQIATGRLATDLGGLLNTSQGPAQSAQRDNLLLPVLAQDVAHAAREHGLPAGVNVSDRYAWWPVFSCRSVAGFGCPPRPEQPEHSEHRPTVVALATLRRRGPGAPLAPLARRGYWRQGAQVCV